VAFGVGPVLPRLRIRRLWRSKAKSAASVGPLPDIYLLASDETCRESYRECSAWMGCFGARVVGQAIAAAGRPPRVWLQMSTATIYAHTYGAPNDDIAGVIGGSEEGVPGYWAFSVDIAQAWERELAEARVPGTRKVALRAAMVMTPDRGGVFDASCCSRAGE
jgi:hypothetical protein